MDRDDSDVSVPLLARDSSRTATTVTSVKARTYSASAETGTTADTVAASAAASAQGNNAGAVRRTISHMVPPDRSIDATHPGALAAPIDWGFDQQGFDLGVVDYLQASDQLLHNQPPLTPASVFGRCIGLTLAGLTVVGLPYVFCQCRVVPAGKIALCRGIGGNVRIVEPGCNCIEFACSKVVTFDVTADQIDLGPMHIIRILPGQVGLATVNGRPYLMTDGRHAVNDAMFQYHGAASVQSPYINVGTIHVVLVPQGMTAVCRVNGIGHFLESGRHHINNPNFQFDPNTSFFSNDTEQISVCSKHRIVVPSGKIGLGFMRGKAVLLNPCQVRSCGHCTSSAIVDARRRGRPTLTIVCAIFPLLQVYNMDNPYFTYKGSVPLSDNQIIHGDIKIIMVQDGKLGISFDDGQLRILQPG